MVIKKLEGYEKGTQAALTRELIEASSAYYGGGNTKLSDLEFDRKVEALRKMEATSGFAYDLSPTIKVGAEVVNELKKVKHEQAALSLDKVKYADRGDLVKWLENTDSAIMSWKCDGSTVVLTYDDGKLIQAATRGDGETGSDITHNAMHFLGVPTNIPCKEHLVVRGEAMMTNAEFERINEEAGGIYENARNLATATVQMLDANESRKREIIFKAFELVTPGTDYYIGDEVPATAHLDYDLSYMGARLEWLEALGFDVVDHEYADSTDVLQKIEEWKEEVQNLPYPTDGLVISYNNLVEGWALGSTGHHPRWAKALKWTDETVTTTIRDIEWSVGKTGVITPVAIFDEVRLGLGSNVSRASLHNLSTMKALSDHTSGNVRSTLIIGAKAEVYMANLIIPQVASVTVDEDTEAAITPFRCPVCGKLTSVHWNPVNGVETLHCTNKACGAQQIGKLMNTFGKDGLFVKGLGESQIEDLLEIGLVESPADFYSLRTWTSFPGDKEYELAQNLLEKDGWGKKKWENLLDAIDASRKTTLQKFLYSLNIPLLGNDLSKKLAKYWHNDIEAFRIFVVGVDEGAGEAGYELVTNAPTDWSGNYVITYGTDTSMYVMTGVSPSSNGAQIESTANAATYANAGVSLSGSTLTNVANSYIFKLAKRGSYYSIQSASTNAYIGEDSSSYLAGYTTYTSGNCDWTPGTLDNASSALNANNGSYPLLGFSTGSSYFWSGSTTSGATAAKNVRFWRENGGDLTYYTTSPVGAHEHTYGEWTSNNDGTHSHTCAECGDVATESCTYNDVVTAPTVTEQGYTTHTCTVCGYSYVDSYTDALGYTVSFSVPNGVTAPAAMNCQAGASITLPTAGAPTGYTFLGWVTEDVNNVTEMPTVLTGSYSATADITLKALYSHVETTVAGYELLTEAPADWTGSYVITCGNTADAKVLKGVAGTKKLEAASAGATAAFNTTGMTLDGTALNNVTDVYVFNVIANGDKFVMQNASTGTYLANRGSYLYSYKTLTASYCLWSLAMVEGVVDATNASSKTRPHLTFNTAKNYFMVNSSAENIFFWKMGGSSSTTTYTTVID